MLEKMLLKLLTISLYANIALAFISIVLLIILAVIIIKNNHSSARQ